MIDIYIYIHTYLNNYIPDFVRFGVQNFFNSHGTPIIRGALQLGVQLGQLPCHDGLQTMLQPGGK